jgi:uncharacterized protein YjiS (DUF1127 family)
MMSASKQPRTALDAGQAAAGARGGPHRWLIRRLAEAWQLRRARRQLLRLSDAMLHDLGISRSEIDYGVRHGRDRPAGG